MFGAAQWKHYAGLTGFWHRAAGSLSLAYREEAWQVLQEYGAGMECLSVDEIAARYPAANLKGLRGGLFSGAEVQIRSANALEHLRAALGDAR